MDSFHATGPLPAPPWTTLRRRLLERAEQLSACGHADEAAFLRGAVAFWWREQLEWNAAVIEVLRSSHEINNALVGVTGNAQLLLMMPAAQQPAIRDRLQTVIRESDRIGRAVRLLQGLKLALAAPPKAGGGADAGDAENAA
jgi:signal transduction histidine kinase